jgi:hypothetical protein
MKHPIDRYCARRKITRSELARRASLSPQFLADVVAGRRRCGRLSALALRKASRGELKIADLIVPDPEPIVGAGAAA